MAHWVSFSNWPGLKPGVEGAPRKKRRASSFLLLLLEDVWRGRRLLFLGSVSELLSLSKM